MSGLAQKARAMDEAARYHKSQVSHHRREARACREKQAELETMCKRMGIEIEYQSEGETHGRSFAKSGYEDTATNQD